MTNSCPLSWQSSNAASCSTCVLCDMRRAMHAADHERAPLLLCAGAAPLALRSGFALGRSGAVRAAAVPAHSLRGGSLRIARLALPGRIHLADFQLTLLHHVRRYLHR